MAGWALQTGWHIQARVCLKLCSWPCSPEPPSALHLLAAVLLHHAPEE